jgi:hypothetical protein
MTRDEAAEALEALVEARGPDWVANTWGIARDRLAGWLEGSEDLPDWMVTVMQVWTSAQREKAGDVGCFEDADDHPPEVPEDVTETGLDAVPMPTVGRGEIRMDEEKSRGETLWDHYRLKTRGVYATGLRELEDCAWQAAGEQCGLIEALDQFEWLPEIMPVSAWDKGANWESLIRALADVVRCAIEGDEA